jgi:CheY-like chemotaxis protein
MSPLVSSARHSKVMVVDDDNLSLSLTCLLLKADGYPTLQADGGAAAVELLTHLAPHDLPSAVLADLRMPGLSGNGLAAALRRVAPNIRLIAMSATPGQADGYDAFVKKPLDLVRLRAALDGRGGPGSETSSTDREQLVGQDKLPILDEAVWGRMSGMMPLVAVREVYEACLSDVRARTPEMRTAATNNDLSSVRRTAHTFKGSAGMVGAKRLAAAAAELELGAYQPDDVAGMIDNLLSCCDELHRMLMSKL